MQKINYKKVEVLKSFFGVKLKGNETFDELLKIESNNRERIALDNLNILRVDAQILRVKK